MVFFIFFFYIFLGDFIYIFYFIFLFLTNGVRYIMLAMNKKRNETAQCFVCALLICFSHFVFKKVSYCAPLIIWGCDFIYLYTIMI